MESTFVKHHFSGHNTHVVCQSAANSLAKKGTEHHKPKPATRDAHGVVKAPPRSSNLSSALQQWELYDRGTLMASLQLLPERVLVTQ